MTLCSSCWYWNAKHLRMILCWTPCKRARVFRHALNDFQRGEKAMAFGLRPLSHVNLLAYDLLPISLRIGVVSRNSFFCSIYTLIYHRTVTTASSEEEERISAYPIVVIDSILLRRRRHSYGMFREGLVKPWRNRSRMQITERVGTDLYESIREEIRCKYLNELKWTESIML